MLWKLARTAPVLPCVRTILPQMTRRCEGEKLPTGQTQRRKRVRQKRRNERQPRKARKKKREGTGKDRSDGDEEQ